MARKREKTKTGQAVTDYRHEDAKRVNIPPAGLAAQGKISEKPKIRYAYDPNLLLIRSEDVGWNLSVATNEKRM